MARQGTIKEFRNMKMLVKELDVGGVATFTGTAVAAATFTGNLRITVNPTVVAVGTNLATAAQLLEGFQTVSAADGTVGVKLPATPVAGTTVMVKGVTAGILKVYPDAAATINAIGSNGAMSLATGAMPATFVAASATQWYTTQLVPS